MLYDRLAQTYQRLNSLPSRFGDPRYGEVSVTHQGQETNLSPNLKITKIDPGKIGMMLSQSVELQGDEWMVSGIARTVPMEVLRGGVWKVQGKKADLLYLDEAKSGVTVKAVVRYRDTGK